MKKNWKIILFSVLIILTFVAFYFKEIKAPSEDIITVPVAFANTEIPANTVISQSMVSLKEVPEDRLVNEKDYIKDLNSVVGKRSKFLIYKDEVIRDTRLIENKISANNNTTDRKEYSFKIETTEKALNLKEGVFVDIYLVPNSKGLEELKNGELLFEKRQVLYLKDEQFREYSPELINDQNKDSVSPAYIILDFNNTELVKLLSINKNLYDFKIVSYGEHLISKILEEKENTLIVEPVEKGIDE
jgi:hypothetical protein